MLEHRFYLGGNAPRGVYLAPYSRYNNFSLERSTQERGTQESGTQYTTTVKGAVGGFGFGGAAGVQFRIGDFLTLDATLAGIDFKWMNGTFTYKTDNPETDLNAFRDQVQEAVGDIPFIGSKLVAAIDGNAVKVRTPGLVMPAYRFNLTVNYSFEPGCLSGLHVSRHNRATVHKCGFWIYDLGFTIWDLRFTIIPI